MANKKFTELPQANAITGAEILAMVQDGGSVQGDIDLIKAYLDTLYPAKKTYITGQATPARVTGAAPDALGEYRSYLRNASARTYTETNGSPTTAPSSSNGYRLYNGNGFGSNDTNNEPTRYEVFIGTGKEPEFEFYTSTGRTGLVNIQTWITGGPTLCGTLTGYDPTTGIAFVNVSASNTYNQSPGTDALGVEVGDIYFDIKC